MTEIFNRKELRERRKVLRRNAPESERLLWERIRKKQVRGMRFRRQVSIGGYVVDFYCPKFHLAIEIDGESHASESAHEYDLIREDSIRQLGIQLLRFHNREIHENIELVVEAIEKAVTTLPPSEGGKEGG